jgi:hypothetical protein
MKWYYEGIELHSKLFDEELKVRENWTLEDWRDWNSYKPARNDELQKEFDKATELNIRKELIKYNCGETNNYEYLIEREKEELEKGE